MLSWKNEKQSLRINREKEREDGIYLFKRTADGQKDAEIPFIERRKKTNHNTKLAPPELLWQRRKARLSNFWTFCPR